MNFIVGNRYNWKHQPERLVYMGKHRGWHQFRKLGETGVWCEVLDSDAHLLEESKEQCNRGCNCPWSAELKEHNYRECGRLSHGSGQ